MTDLRVVFIAGQSGSELAPHMELGEVLSERGYITDVTGVPLESDRSPLAGDIDFDYKACPFADSPSRFPNGQPHEQPLSGLEHQRLMEAYPRVRRLLLAMRGAYQETFIPEQDRSLHVLDGLNIMTMLQYMPGYLANRAHNPVPSQGAMPVHIVVGANSAAGSVGALGAYAHGNIGLELPSGEAALAATEAEGSLVGSNNTVCAAPSRMIINFLDLLRDGSDKIAHGNIEAETDGLLEVDEITSLQTFSTHIESLGSVHQMLRQLDARYASQMSGYNPRKHNPRRGRNILRDFKTEVAPLLSMYKVASCVVNACLGREQGSSDEFSRILTADNQFRLATIADAHRKGLSIED